MAANVNEVYASSVDHLGLPQLPDIPKIQFCLHFPWTTSWNSHWIEFNKKIKDFHQSMIDFNWKILEWYTLKSKQLERFGMQYSYIAGRVVTGGRMTIIYAKPICDGDVVSEVRKCLPNAVKEHEKHLEKKGYKLCLTGKIFIFDDERIVVIDYDNDSDKTSYRNCLKFTLYYQNEKLNISEAYKRVYGGLKYSFIIGGIGGLVVSLLTGYFGRQPIYSRRSYPERSLLWLAIKRFLSSSIVYTIVERVLLLKFPRPQKYILSGSTGVLCGTFFGFCGEIIYLCAAANKMIVTLRLLSAELLSMEFSRFFVTLSSVISNTQEQSGVPNFRHKDLL